MKNIKLILLFAIFPLFLSAQKTLTGVWTGALTNDSAEARNDQRFEMALTEYRGKVYGYSYATFIEDDHLYYIVKRVKGEITDGVCEVTDDELVSTNLFGKLDKKVKRTITFRMNASDSVWHLDGTWKTNKTKQFYAITGNISLKEEKDLNKSPLYEHLGDLNLQKDLALSDKKPEEKTKPAPKETIKREDALVKNDTKTPETDKPEKKSAGVNKNKEEKKEQEIVVKTEAGKKKKETDKPAGQKDKQPETAVVKNQPEAIAKTEPAPPLPKITPPAAEIKTRKKTQEDVVYFKSDSLVLALYDNGEVDGDTVSVLLNGEMLLAKQGLKSTAIKKTIYITPEMNDSLELVLYAENLGLYPPNTGLLVVYDGTERYLIRFSADFDRNAAIVFKRKKP